MNRPDYIRIPPADQRCHRTGLDARYMRRLVDSGKVVVADVKEEGASRGVVLVKYQSLLDYLEEFEHRRGAELEQGEEAQG